MKYLLETDEVRAGVDGNHFVEPDGRFDFVLRLGTGELRPGLINAHDHLHRNHYPRLGRPPYEDAYAWGRDLHASYSDEIARARALPRRDALLFGALKNLVGGVTTVVHHDAWEQDFDADFPLRVARLRCVHSLGFDSAGVADAAAGAHAARAPFAIHIAEGVNAAAAAEVRTLERAGLLDGSLLAVHAVGVDADAVERLHAARAAIVWCPTSNLFLFGRTAPASLLRGADVLLGTDSLLTGAGTLLDELRAARALGCIHDDRLRSAVGDLAAHRLGLPPPTLEPGTRADLVLLRRPLLDAAAGDVALVIAGGMPRIADPEFAALFERMHLPAEEIRVGETIRLASRPLGAIARRVLREWPQGGGIFTDAAVPSVQSSVRTSL